MDMGMPSADLTLWWVRLLLLGCLSLVMVSSTLDKIFGWAGTAAYTRRSFSKSRLAPAAVPLLVILSVLMGAGAVCCVGGMVQLVFGADAWLGWLGALLSALTFLALLFGLQVSKDHESARSVTVLFLISVVTLGSFAA